MKVQAKQVLSLSSGFSIKQRTAVLASLLLGLTSASSWAAVSPIVIDDSTGAIVATVGGNTGGSLSGPQSWSFFSSAQAVPLSTWVGPYYYDFTNASNQISGILTLTGTPVYNMIHGQQNYTGHGFWTLSYEGGSNLAVPGSPATLVPETGGFQSVTTGTQFDQLHSISVNPYVPSASPVPEPTTPVLLGLGALAYGLLRRKVVNGQRFSALV